VWVFTYRRQLSSRSSYAHPPINFRLTENICFRLHFRCPEIDEKIFIFRLAKTGVETLDFRHNFGGPEILNFRKPKILPET